MAAGLQEGPQRGVPGPRPQPAVASKQDRDQGEPELQAQGPEAHRCLQGHAVQVGDLDRGLGLGVRDRDDPAPHQVPGHLRPWTPAQYGSGGIKPQPEPVEAPPNGQRRLVARSQPLAGRRCPGAQGRQVLPHPTPRSPQDDGGAPQHQDQCPHRARQPPAGESGAGPRRRACAVRSPGRPGPDSAPTPGLGHHQQPQTEGQSQRPDEPAEHRLRPARVSETIRPRSRISPASITEARNRSPRAA